MSMKDEFSEDEWFLLGSTPALIGATMSGAARSGVIGTIKEMSAGMRGTVQGLSDYPDSALIQALLEKAENWDEAKEKMQDYRERSRERLESASVDTPEKLQALMLEDCKQAVALVDQKCSAEDARIYREWSLKIATRVAEASSEGGFLGFGGERVSEAEQQLLARIEEALGVSTGHLFA